MFSTFKLRLYVAALAMFVIFLVLNFLLLGFIGKIKNRSYIQAVLGSTSISLLRVDRDVASIIYLAKLRKSNLEIANLNKKTYDATAIDKKINSYVNKIKSYRKNNVIAINGFYSGFKNEKFKEIYGIKKALLKRPGSLKNKASEQKMSELKQIMASYRPNMAKLLQNPSKEALKMNPEYFNDNIDKIIKLLDFDRYEMSSGMSKKINFLYGLFIAAPFIMLIALLSVSFYFKKFLIDELEIAIKKVHEVADGDLSSKIKVNVNPKNEIGRLINHVNTLIESFSSNVKSISKAAASISGQGEELNHSSKELEDNLENMKQNSTSIIESISVFT